VDRVTQNQLTVQLEVLTDSGQTVYTAVDIVTQKQHMVQCEVRIDS